MTTPAREDRIAHANERLLLEFYDAVGRGDLDAALNLLSEDVEWRVHRPSPSAGTYHGKEEVLDWFGRMAGPYEGTLRVDATAIVANAEYGFVLVHESAGVPAPISYTGVHVWQFAGGRISRFESYYDESYAEFWLARSRHEA